MTNRFLTTSGGDVDISDGSAYIFGAKLGAQNLDPGLPIKTNSSLELYSTLLETKDISGLDAKLGSGVSNPMVNDLDANQFDLKNIAEVEIKNGVNTATLTYSGGTNKIIDLDGLAMGDVEYTGTISLDGGIPIYDGTDGKKIKDSNFTITTNQLTLPLGTVAAPSLVFLGDTTSGLYSTGANDVGISAGGFSRILADPFSITLNATLIDCKSNPLVDVLRVDGSNSLAVRATVDQKYEIAGTERFSISSFQAMFSNLAAVNFNNIALSSVSTIGNGSSLSFLGTNDFKFDLGGVDKFQIDGVNLRMGSSPLTDWTLPLARGTNNQLLISNAAGVVSFADNPSVLKSGDIMAGNLTVINGSATTPGLNFVGNTNTGIYRVSPQSFGISAGGVKRMEINNAGITIGDTPNHYILPISRGTNNQILLSDGSGNVSFSNNPAVLKAGDTMTGQLLLHDGSTANPSIGFTNNNNLGIYRDGSNSMTLTANGFPVCKVNANGLEMISVGIGHQIKSHTGLANPGFSFNGSTTDGLASDTLNTVSLITNSVQRLRATNTNIVIGAGGVSYNIPLTRGTNNQILSSDGSGNMSFKSASALSQTITMATMEFMATGTTPINIGYAIWDNSKYSGLPQGKVLFHYTTSANRSLTVDIYDGTSVIGSTTIAIGAATGIKTFNITNSVSDKQLILRLSKDNSGGTDALLRGCQIIFG